MKHNIKMVLADDVYKKIKWMTQNYENEIGAFGTVKVKQHEGERYFYVDELFFPKQKVTTTTVHITPEMMVSLYKNPRFKERMKEVNFYWHKHPGGCPKHSFVDEEDTFETLMSTEANRKKFLFLQTAEKDGIITRDARIDIRTPVRHTITNENIDLIIGDLKEEENFEIEMEALLDEVIEIPKITQKSNYQLPNRNQSQKQIGDWNWYNKKEDNINEDNLKGIMRLFSNVERDPEKGTLYMDNDLFKNVAVTEEEKASICIKTGHILIKSGKLFAKVMEDALKKDVGNLDELITKVRNPELKTNGMFAFDIQPKKKKYVALQNAILNLFIKYNEKLYKNIREELQIENFEKNYDSIENKGDIEQSYVDDEPGFFKKSNSCYEIKGHAEVHLLISNLESMVTIDWDSSNKTGMVNIYQGTKSKSNLIGTLKHDSDWTYMNIYGKDAVQKVDEIVAYLDEYEDNEYMAEEPKEDNIINDNKQDLSNSKAC